MAGSRLRECQGGGLGLEGVGMDGRGVWLEGLLSSKLGGGLSPEGFVTDSTIFCQPPGCRFHRVEVLQFIMNETSQVGRSWFTFLQGWSLSHAGVDCLGWFLW